MITLRHTMLLFAAVTAWAPVAARAQRASPKPDTGMAGMPGMVDMPAGDSARMLDLANGAMSGMAADAKDVNMARHMRMTPARPASRADSARARQIVIELRSALAKYKDPAAAEADGYRKFLPNVKNQKVFHFTNYRLAFMEAFRFDPAKPTSLLYQPQPDGTLKLIGAMYTAPKRFTLDQLDARIPLGIVHWHEHVDWCLPPRDRPERWLEQKDGQPLFGPQSPVATQAECEQAGGRFFPLLFNWMVHANVFLGDDPAVIWGEGA